MGQRKSKQMAHGHIGKPEITDPEITPDLTLSSFTLSHERISVCIHMALLAFLEVLDLMKIQSEINKIFGTFTHFFKLKSDH